MNNSQAVKTDEDSPAGPPEPEVYSLMVPEVFSLMVPCLMRSASSCEDVLQPRAVEQKNMLTDLCFAFHFWRTDAFI